MYETFISVLNNQITNVYPLIYLPKKKIELAELKYVSFLNTNPNIRFKEFIQREPSHSFP